MGVMLVTLGKLTEFHVSFNAIWSSVKLIFEEKNKEVAEEEETMQS